MIVIVTMTRASALGLILMLKVQRCWVALPGSDGHVCCATLVTERDLGVRDFAAWVALPMTGAASSTAMVCSSTCMTATLWVSFLSSIAAANYVINWPPEGSVWPWCMHA